MQKARNWQSTAFTLSIISSIQGLLLLPVAMLTYAGGTAADTSSPGFSLLYNFFSDLGRLTAYSGQSNLLSSVIFN
ncbi:MAG: hypothetical protein ACXAEF_03145, partial [Candidatus Thorarchaeota archaeon]